MADVIFNEKFDEFIDRQNYPIYKNKETNNQKTNQKENIKNIKNDINETQIPFETNYSNFNKFENSVLKNYQKNAKLFKNIDCLKEGLVNEVNLRLFLTKRNNYTNSEADELIHHLNLDKNKQLNYRNFYKKLENISNLKNEAEKRQLSHASVLPVIDPRILLDNFNFSKLKKKAQIGNYSETANCFLNSFFIQKSVQI